MLTSLDLINPTITRIVKSRQDYVTGDWLATVVFKGQRYKVTVTRQGTNIQLEK